MKSGLPPATADELLRQSLCRNAGCEACHQLGLPKAEHCGPTEYHHFTDSGRQIGHRFGCGLGAYHHQGKVKPGWTIERMQEKYGTNLRDDKRGFHARFGSQQALQNGQDDRIGHERVQIPSRRELRLREDSRAPRKPSRCTASSKTVKRPESWRP